MTENSQGRPDLIEDLRFELKPNSHQSIELTNRKLRHSRALANLAIKYPHLSVEELHYHLALITNH